MIFLSQSPHPQANLRAARSLRPGRIRLHGFTANASVSGMAELTSVVWRPGALSFATGNHEIGCVAARRWLIEDNVGDPMRPLQAELQVAICGTIDPPILSHRAVVAAMSNPQAACNQSGNSQSARGTNSALRLRSPVQIVAPCSIEQAGQMGRNEGWQD